LSCSTDRSSTVITHLTSNERSSSPLTVDADKDLTDVGLTRQSPIYHAILSKLFERIVAQRIWEHPQQFELLPVGQSGFRPRHSSKTAILLFYRIYWLLWNEVNSRSLPLLMT
jgi:hypothetical protein